MKSHSRRRVFAEVTAASLVSIGLLALASALQSGCAKTGSSLVSGCTSSIHCGLFLTDPTVKPGSTYFYSFGQANATPGNYTLSTVSGSLPPSLSVKMSGAQAQISGTVDSTLTKADYPVTFRLFDQNLSSCDIPLTFKVDPAAADITNIAPSILQQTMTATCASGEQLQFVPSCSGPNACTWALTTGTLPSGVTLDTSTGIVSGTTGSSFAVTLKANDPITTKVSSSGQDISVTFGSSSGGSGTACGGSTCSGSEICVSSRSCIYGSSCECSGSTTGTCADYVSRGGYNHPTSCSTEGSDCGSTASGSNPLCCSGLTCTNGTCKSGCP